MTLLHNMYGALVVHHSMVISAAGPKTRCDLASQIKGPLYQIVGDVKGLAILFGSVVGVVILCAMIVLWKTERLRGLLLILGVVLVADILLVGGVTFTPASTC